MFESDQPQSQPQPQPSQPPQYYQTPPQQYIYVPPMPIQQHPKKGFCVASLVLGIVAFVTGIVGCLPFISIPSAIVGLILGIIGNRTQRDNMAIAGIIICVTGLAISILISVAFATVFFAAFSEAMKDISTI